MLRAINVWAWHEGLTNVGTMQRAPICSDASVSANRLGSGGHWVAHAGWHLAVSFSSFSDLANKLESATVPDYIRRGPRTLQRGEIQTLAIDCHGRDGGFYPNGVSDGNDINVRNLDNFGPTLRRIGLMTSSQNHNALIPNPSNPTSPFMQQSRQDPSTIILMSCNTGAGPRGTALLEQLSYRWPNRRVVAFSTTLVIPHLNPVNDPATNEACVAPFSLDSGQHGMRRSEADTWLAEFNRNHSRNPRPMPFADASASNAKIARNGRIIDWPENEPRRHTSLGSQLNGPPRGNTARPTHSAQANRRLV